MKIKEILQEGNKILNENKVEDYNLKSKILLSKLLGKEKEYLVIHDEDNIEKELEDVFFLQITKLVNGVPIQYIINEQYFMGLKFYVDENVLIPQPDTEILVEEVLNKIENNYKILDLCTGSGAIGISIAKFSNKNNICIDISDISIKALNVAKKNANINKVNVNFIESNLFDNINTQYDIIVSNPPYIETYEIKKLSKEVQNEPKIALDGGEDGLVFYRKIAKKSKKFLKPCGKLFLEIGYNQKNDVIKILKEEGYVGIYYKKDYGNNDRIIACNKGE